MKITIVAGKTEVAGVLALLHKSIPATQAITGLRAADAKLEADVDTPAGSVRAQIELLVSDTGTG